MARTYRTNLAPWRHRIAAAGLLVVALIGLAHAAASLTFPTLTGRVVDRANLLSPEQEKSIDGKLAELESKTTTQLVVVTLPSLQDHDIADYGYQLGRHWGIGQRGANNGALLIVAPNERKVRIEVGYGLEGTLTDAVTRLIIANAITPRFKAGDFPGGIERGVDDIILALSGGAEDFKQRAAEQSRSEDPDIEWFIILVLFLGFWLILMISAFRQEFRKGGRSSGRSSSSSSSGWSSGSSWSSGGSSWSSGSSGGGFSGGGGSFGGGGSSGSW